MTILDKVLGHTAVINGYQALVIMAYWIVIFGILELICYRKPKNKGDIIIEYATTLLVSPVIIWSSWYIWKVLC